MLVQEDFAASAADTDGPCPEKDEKAAPIPVRNAALASLLHFSNAMLYGLHDPEYGAAGQDFMVRLALTGCSEQLGASHQPAAAVFVPFEGPGQPSYVNSIYYRTHMPDDKDKDVMIARDPESVAVSRIHEGTHAIATMASPALFSSVFNGSSRVFMSPRDWVFMTLRTEEDAYAKQAWLASLAGPSYNDLTQLDPIPAGFFRHLRANSPDLKGALTSAAKLSLDKHWGHHDGLDRVVNFRDYYTWYALHEYENMVDIFVKNDIKPQIVRLEGHHLKDVGNTFGPNVFDNNDPHFRTVPAQEPEFQAIIDRIHKKLGIKDEAALPLFETVLAARGMGAYDFMADSMQPSHRKYAQETHPILMPEPVATGEGAITRRRDLQIPPPAFLPKRPPVAGLHAV